jgi:GWxTD domain-containing protein
MHVTGIRNRPWLILICLFLSIPIFSAQGQDQQRAAKRKETSIRVISDFPYHKWLDEDVRYIITDQERADFNKLTDAKQRDDFVEAFWEHRNPTPGAEQNTFKEQHYQRFAYSNEHFAAGVAGWKTDRGRIYIVYGTPDEIDSHPRGGRLETTQAADAPAERRHPYEIWRYKLMKGVGENVSLEFVDACECGDYRLHDHPTQKRPPSEKD